MDDGGLHIHNIVNYGNKNTIHMLDCSNYRDNLTRSRHIGTEFIYVIRTIIFLQKHLHLKFEAFC